MTKRVGSIVLLVVLALSLCTGAFAAEESRKEAGFYGFVDINDSLISAYRVYNASGNQINPEENVTLEGVGAVNGFYSEAAYIEVDCTGLGANDHALVLTQTEKAAPTQSTDIIYINQEKTGENGQITFKIYPKTVKSNTPCYVYFTSSSNSFDKDHPAMTFNYFPGKNYILGDVNADEEVDIQDAQEILYYCASRPSLVDPDDPGPADVNADEEVDIQDAQEILYYCASRPSLVTGE